MPNHFLGLDAHTLRTPSFELAQDNVRDVVRSRAMGVFFGVSARSRGTAALKEPPIIPAEGREPALLVASRKLRKT